MNTTVLLESGPLALSAEPGQSLLDVLREHGACPSTPHAADRAPAKSVPLPYPAQRAKLLC